MLRLDRTLLGRRLISPSCRRLRMERTTKRGTPSDRRDALASRTRPHLEQPVRRFGELAEAQVPARAEPTDADSGVAPDSGRARGVDQLRRPPGVVATYPT